MSHLKRIYCNERAPLAKAMLAKIMLAAALAMGMMISGTTATHAQTNNQPWGFTQQNRASIAALMKQIEEKETTQAATTAAAGGYDQLVCGKDGESSATGNNTCIIMNNSDGVIQIGQDANGNQSATSNTETNEVDNISDALDEISNED